MAIKRFAAIDVGSFELELGIYEIGKTIGIRRIDYIRHIIALGKDTYNTGKINYDLIEEMCTVLRDFAFIMSGYQVDAYRAYATSAMREAKNRRIILDRIKVRTGLDVKIISNSEQRLINYKAVASFEDNFNASIEHGAVIADLGFGSVQLTLFNKSEMINSQNFPFGALRIHEMTAASSAGRDKLIENISKMVDYDLEIYRKLFVKNKDIKTCICIGDPILYLFRKAGLYNNKIIKRDNFIEFYENVIKLEADEIEEKFEINHRFSSIILPSIIIYRRIIEKLDISDIWLPGIQLIDGIAAEYTKDSRIIKTMHDFSGDIIAISRNIAKRYKADGNDSECLEVNAVGIFDAMKKIHGLNDRDRLLLRLSCILHNVGRFISIKNAIAATKNIIESTEIIGISHDERLLIAEVAAGSIESLNYRDVKAAKLMAILKLAQSLSRTYKEQVKDYKFKVEAEKLVISTAFSDDMIFEILAFEANKAYFEEICGIQAILKRKRIY